MPIRRDLKPDSVPVPTRSSLRMAKMVADRLGIPFDADAVANQSATLYETMFDDLAGVLALDVAGLHLESGSYSLTRMFLTVDAADRPVIVLDLVFDYWIAALTHLAAIATFEALSDEDLAQLAAQAAATLALIQTPRGFQAARKGMAPYFVERAEILNVSHALARAMTVFGLCHEIAHAELGHLDLPPDPAHEIEADVHAARHFRAVLAAADRETSVYVDPKVAGAPITLMRLFMLLEDWLAAEGYVPVGTHPPARARRDAVAAVLDPALDPIARQLIDGLDLGIADLSAALFTRR